MIHQNCKLGAVQQQGNEHGFGGYGFVVTAGGQRPIPVVSLTYDTKAKAEEAHGLMAKVIEGAEITPHS